MLNSIKHALHFGRQYAASWRAHEANLQSLRNEVNALQVAVKGLRDEAYVHDVQTRHLLEELRSLVSQTSAATTHSLSRQVISARLPALYRPQASIALGVPAKPYRLEDKLKALQALHPAAYEVWIKAFDEGRRAYELNPVENLSVEGHRDAEVFRAFIAPYMSGSVLDIGCGPQEMPVYLRGFNLDRVAGLDPLAGHPRRQMEFCQGFAEFLPWEDEQFDVVLFATSLDHVLSLEKTLDEVCRVLRSGGKCIVWAGLIPGSALYEPDREPVSAVDEYHLFHFSEETLLETFRSRFELFESCTYYEYNGFYVFNKIDLE